jgi:uncharacterized protein YdhG (YjbR/CyaY superfamily)
MSGDEVDRYLHSVEEPKRTTLAHLRQTILEIIPDAEQGISYGVPAFKIRGKTIAGFAAFKNHLSYLPHSGSVFTRLRNELAGYSMSSGALRFGIDEPLPRELVEQLISVRLDEAFPASGRRRQPRKNSGSST